MVPVLLQEPEALEIHRTGIINLNLSCKGVWNMRFLTEEAIDPNGVRMFSDVGQPQMTNVRYSNEMTVAVL